jgi:predicted secreted protein
MAADIGLGITIAFESSTPGTFTTVGSVHDTAPPGVSVDSIDVTEYGHTNGFRRFIPGLADAGEASFSIHYDPELSAYTDLYTLAAGRTVKNWQITFPGGAEIGFSGFITNLQPATPLDDKMTCDFTIKVSGAPTVAAS